MVPGAREKVSLGWREKGTLALVTSQRSDSFQVFPGRGERDGCHFERTPETDRGEEGGGAQFLLAGLHLERPRLGGGCFWDLLGCGFVV